MKLGLVVVKKGGGGRISSLGTQMRYFSGGEKR